MPALVAELLFGVKVCTECSPSSVIKQGFNPLPFKQIIATCELTDQSKAVIVAYKDQNAQGLSCDIADILAEYVSPEIYECLVGISYLPSSKKAHLRRGFDHMHLVATRLSELLDVELFGLFLPPKSLDQRTLNRAGRLENMLKAVSLGPGIYTLEEALTSQFQYFTRRTGIHRPMLLGKAVGQFHSERLLQTSTTERRPCLLLIDDVLTTGASMGACAKLIKSAIPSLEIVILCFARAW